MLKGEFMSDTTQYDTIKAAAKYFREQLAVENLEIGSSHAHAAISAYCSYNSKKAMIDDGPDLEDPNLILSITPNLEKLGERIAEMKETPLQTISLPRLGNLIATALTPACECCGIKKRQNKPIGDPSELYFDPDGWVCSNCVESEDDYATCRYCGPDVIYRAEQINDQGECQEHNGESVMDEEEKQGWQDLREYFNKD